MQLVPMCVFALSCIRYTNMQDRMVLIRVCLLLVSKYITYRLNQISLVHCKWNVHLYYGPLLLACSIGVLDPRWNAWVASWPAVHAYCRQHSSNWISNASSIERRSPKNALGIVAMMSIWNVFVLIMSKCTTWTTLDKWHCIRYKWLIRQWSFLWKCIISPLNYTSTGWGPTSWIEMYLNGSLSVWDRF